MANKSFLRRSETALHLLLAFACIATVDLILDDQARNIDQAIAHLRTEREAEVNELKLRVESQFRLIHQGLRTIARLPAVREIDRYGENLSSDAHVSIREIYSNLASNVEISELYIVPLDFDPDAIDPKTGDLEEPIVEFDDFIASSQPSWLGGEPTVVAADREAYESEKIEIFEYRKMRAQLESLKQRAPSEAGVAYENWPALMSQEVITCDNRFYSPSQPDDHARQGIIYSAPFYRPSGELGGMISAVILTTAVERMLREGDHAIVNNRYELTIAHDRAISNLLRTRPATTKIHGSPLLFSSIIPISISDFIGGWTMWYGVDASALEGNESIDNAHRGTMLRLTLILIIWIGASAIIRLLFSRQQVMADRNLELEAHVEARTRDLVSAKAEAERANAAKSRFLASVSHEIRTPLSAIIGNAELLVANPGSASYSNRLKTIRSAGDSLLTLINQILNVSSIEAGRHGGHAVEARIDSVVREVMAMFSRNAREKGLSLEADITGAPPRPVMIDDVSLRQVLINLVGNALKFTECGSVLVRVSSSSADDDGRRRIRFEVIDSGIGVSEEMREAIFEPFRQESDEISRAHGGVGLGLAISRTLVEQLGGALELESAPGAGSRFQFTVEVSPAAEKPPQPDASLRTQRALPETEPLRGRNLLVVEDNAQMRELTQSMLSQAGAVTRSAKSGREALSILEHERFDAILMDCRMPGLDGEETTRRIRQGEIDGAATPIIGLSASAFESNRRACMEAGMTAFLSKPFSSRQLVETVAEVLTVDAVS